MKFLCDRLTVLKGGRSLGTYNVAEVTEKDITRKMVGREVKLSYGKKAMDFKDSLLQVRSLKYRDKFGVQKVDGVSFSLRSGEILGIAGIEGNGQLEVMNAITGNLEADEGQILFQCEDLRGLSIRAIRDRGIAHISEDRSYNGSAPEMSLRDNLITVALRRFSSRLGLLSSRMIEEYCDLCAQEYQIVAHSLDAPIKSLSGGNIQKAILAREFSGAARVIVLNQPTRGVDVGAMEFIHRKILEMRELGKSILLLSSDLSELKVLSDRILVMFKGKVAGVIDNVAETSDEELGLYMLGLKRDHQEKPAAHFSSEGW